MPPLKLLPLVVQVKSAWSDNWVTMPDVEPISASLSAASVGSFQFRLRYGYVKYPIETQISMKQHTQANSQWVRCLRSPYTSSDILFQGRIESDTRDVFGAASGVQIFTAYDGVQLLNKIDIQSSLVEQGGVAKVHDTLLPFNAHPTSPQKTLNRSTVKIDGHYVYQIDGVAWTVDDAIEYLIGAFVNETGSPVWTITGSIPSEIEPLSFGGQLTALEFLQTVMNQQTGYSYIVIPNSAGYELKVFSLAVDEVTFGTVTVPANPETVTITNASNPEIELKLEESQVNARKKISVLGKPMVICRTISTTAGQLIRDWEQNPASQIRMDYTNTDDRGRRNAQFKNLWCRFVADMDPAVWLANNNPTLKSDGTLDFTTAGPVPVFSASLRSLPIQDGVEYQSGAPSLSADGDFTSPMLFVKDILGWREFKSLGVSGQLLALPDAVGVHVMVDVPHVFSASDHGPFELGGNFEAEIEVDEARLTIAFESAQRLRREHVESGATKADGEIIIKVDDAEFWWMAYQTVVGVWGNNEAGTNGDLKTVESTGGSGSEGQILRDDGPKLDRVMAGAIVRYIKPRGKASGTARGLFSWHLDIGKVVITDDPDIESILTSVSWSFEDGFTTSLMSGFAVR